MIVEKIFYAVECDACKSKSDNSYGHFFWADRSETEDIARKNCWHEKGDCHYCPSCHSFNDDDELIIKKNNSKSK